MRSLHVRSPFASRCAPRAVAVLLALFAASPILRAQVTPAPASPPALSPALASVRGLVIDSLHGAPLTGALVRVDGSQREAMSDSLGEYHIDSVPPGQHRMIMLHPVLDTLGISLVTPPMTFNAGKREIVDLSLPSSQTLVTLLCTPARRALGPAAMVGFVRDADTDEPAAGSKVSLLWYESDPLGLRKVPKVRESPVGADGRYRICGIPGDMHGKVQVFHSGVSSGEVPVEVKDGFLAMRSMSIQSAAAAPRPVASAETAATAKPAPHAGTSSTPLLRRRSSRVTGRVINKGGQAIVGARVSLEGTGAATITRSNGEFALDSLPAGTQTLQVRQLGYAVTEEAVELSSTQPQRLTIKMGDFAPTLEPMRVEATRDRGLQDVGFESRRRSSAGGYFLTEENFKGREASQFSDVMREVPGIRVEPSGDGHNVITSSRGAANGCVNFYVDGSPWQQQYPGDLDTYVPSSEVVAVEVYSGSNAPPQFQTPGQTGCTTVVIWTVRRIMKKR